ncbi:Uu.00g112490.m01.CDS01 [Anthostomella pinea]|uniref:Uu.00g112490.m01.CDS01 n=1 Tax=Anthostomella pinea TaxID=933095 RepID=A0AAI8YGD2_9PEZI|nr:Uu.00g112490.m01.CDS01 [Anthostomella pinea]
MASVKPAIIIVTGAWVPPSIYGSLGDPLRVAGYEVYTTAHKTNTSEPFQPLPTPYDDAEPLRELTTRLADEGKDIMFVMHSYGGLPGSIASQGLGKKQRQEQGKPGGVVRLFYITAWIAEQGKMGMDSVPVGSYPRVDKFPVEHIVQDGWIKLNLEGNFDWLWEDVSTEQAREYASQMMWCSGLQGATTISEAGYKEIPVSYLVAEHDNVFVPSTQYHWIGLIKDSTTQEVDVHTLPVPHMLMHGDVQKVEEVVKLVERVAGERLE